MNDLSMRRALLVDVPPFLSCPTRSVLLMSFFLPRVFRLLPLGGYFFLFFGSSRYTLDGRLMTMSTLIRGSPHCLCSTTMKSTSCKCGRQHPFICRRSQVGVAS